MGATACQNRRARAIQPLGKFRAAESCDPKWVHVRSAGRAGILPSEGGGCSCGGYLVSGRLSDNWFLIGLRCSVLLVAFPEYFSEPPHVMHKILAQPLNRFRFKHGLYMFHERLTTAHIKGILTLNGTARSGWKHEIGNEMTS